VRRVIYEWLLEIYILPKRSEIQLKPLPQKLFFIFSFVILFVLCTIAPADAPKKILILPFNIHSEKDLSFLQNGIFDMLSTRLSEAGKVVPISKEKSLKAVQGINGPVNEKTAQALGENLQADFVLFGSLTVFGDSISTDSRFLDVNKGTPVVVFNQSGKTQGDVIQHIDIFAGQVNEKVFKRKTYTYKPTLQQKDNIDDTRRHPEAVWAETKGMVSSSEFDTVGQGMVSFDFWKSRRFKTRIIGMAAGDVDGDKNNEVVFISDRIVSIYRYLDRKFIKIGEIEGTSYNHYIGVDVADINENGKAEIFVTNYNSKDRMRSFVLEWNGTEFAKIIDNANWYYRVINVPYQGRILFGQQRKDKLKIFKPGVYEMKWESGEYKPSVRQNLPESITVYGFTYGEVTHDGREMTVAYSYNDRIRIMDKSGDEEWTSSEPYGEGMIFLEFFDRLDATEKVPQDPEKLDRYFLPQRIHIADLDKDGKNDLLLVKNHDVSGETFSRIRMFNNGHIECLTWNQLGLGLKWRTQKISEYISDVTIADLNNDGNDELIFSVVSKTGKILGQSRSYIVSWRPKKEKKE